MGARFVVALVAALTLCGGCARSAEDGWTVTVYYTAVESLHTGEPRRVTGCPELDCEPGDADSGTDLGTYPAGFVTAVRDEGTGRTTGGRYLNWSVDTGYWLDTAPRDSAGGVLAPWESAAADADVLAAGRRFTVATCGSDEVTAEVCDRLRGARWTVRDEFTPGLGGSRHVDLYIGEETGPGFTDSDWYVTLEDARLDLG